MDNLTHSLVGVLIARSAPGGSVPRATVLCVIAANIPDVDIVSMFDPATYLVYHRHITHAIVAIPFMAAFAVLLVNLRGDRPERPMLWRQMLLALAGVGAHVALDMMNSYGVRLWLPFSAEWSSWDLFFIIDPLIWAMLATALLIPRVKRIGGQRTAALLGLLVIMSYGGMKLWMKGDAEADMTRTLEYRREPVEWRLFPAPSSPWDWLAYGENETGKYFFKLPDLSNVVEPIAANDPAILAQLRNDRLGAAYLQFARFPVVISQTGELTLGDVRFMREGLEGHIPFSCRFDIDEEGRISNGRFEF